MNLTPVTAAPQPSPLEAHLGFWLRFVSNHVSARFEQLLAAEEVSVTDWVALRTLYGQAETTPAALIEALGMTKGAASKVISRLEAKAYVWRRPLAAGGRGQVLGLTAQGLALVPRLAALADANDAHFFAGCSPAEQQALLSTLQALVRHHQLKQLPTT